MNYLAILPSVNSLTRVICSKRKIFNLPLAELQNLKEINIPDYLRFNKKVKNFCILTVDLNHILVFTTNKNFQLLSFSLV